MPPTSRLCLSKTERGFRVITKHSQLFGLLDYTGVLDGSGVCACVYVFGLLDYTGVLDGSGVCACVHVFWKHACLYACVHMCVVCACVCACT